MKGPAQVAKLKQRLDATFKRIDLIDDSSEVKSDFAKYLCILVSGFLEYSARELVQEHTRRQSSPTVQSFVESNTRRFTNANSEKLRQLLGRFDSDWGTELGNFLTDERKEAVDSVVTLRNQIAHGQQVGITFVRISEYYEIIKTVVQKIEDLCAPPI